MIAYLLIITFLSIILVIYMYFKAHEDHTRYQHISLDLDKPLVMFFISDIHTRIIKEETLQQISEFIDIVVIGGDLLEKGVRLEQVEKNINRLQDFHAPIYFVWGNNDYEGDISAITKLLHHKGINILRNSAANFIHGEQVISLIGLDCCKMREANFINAIRYAEGTRNILITHHPKAFYELSEEEIDQIDFVVSGHTHGGQIRIFGIGPYEKGGLKQYLNTPILVSEGYGYTKLPLRLGTNSECHVIIFQ